MSIVRRFALGMSDSRNDASPALDTDEQQGENGTVAETEDPGNDDASIPQLPNEILLLILENLLSEPLSDAELDMLRPIRWSAVQHKKKARLLPFAFASKTFLALALPLLYRDVALSTSNEQLNLRILCQDSLGFDKMSFVRSLSLSSYLGNKDTLMQVITACTGLEKLSIAFTAAPICVSVMRALKTKSPSSLKRLELDVSGVQGLKGLSKPPAVTLPLSVRDFLVIGGSAVQTPILAMLESSPHVERIECMGSLTMPGFSFADYPNTRPKITSVAPESGLPVASLHTIRQLTLGFGESGANGFWTAISAFPSLEDLKLSMVDPAAIGRMNLFTGHLNRLVVSFMSFSRNATTQEQRRNGAASLVAKVNLVVIDTSYFFDDASNTEGEFWTGLPNVYQMDNVAQRRKIVWDDHGIWPSLLVKSPKA